MVDIEDFYEDVPHVTLIQKYKQVHELIEEKFLPEFVSTFLASRCDGD